MFVYDKLLDRLREKNVSVDVSIHCDEKEMILHIINKFSIPQLLQM